MIVEKNVVLKHRVPFALFLIQLILAMLVVFQFLAVIGFQFVPETKQLFFGFSSDPLEYFFFFLSLALLYTVFSQSTKKSEDVFVATKMLPFTLKSAASYKLFQARKDLRASSLLLIQFAFVMTVALAIFAYIDPGFSLVQWEQFGVFAPLTTVLNIIIFLLVVLALFFLYKYTESYREEKKKR